MISALQASALQSTSVGADERQVGDLKTSVFGQRLQLHFREVILTTGIYVTFVLCLSPMRLYNSANVLKETRTKSTSVSNRNSSNPHSHTSPRLPWKAEVFHPLAALT